MSGVLGIHAHFHHLILKDLFRRNPPGQKKEGNLVRGGLGLEERKGVLLCDV